jgi:hypothetical protein
MPSWSVVVEHVIEQVGAANAGESDPAAMLGFVADLAKQVNEHLSQAQAPDG